MTDDDPQRSGRGETKDQTDPANDEGDADDAVLLPGDEAEVPLRFVHRGRERGDHEQLDKHETDRDEEERWREGELGDEGVDDGRGDREVVVQLAKDRSERGRLAFLAARCDVGVTGSCVGEIGARSVLCPVWLSGGKSSPSGPICSSMATGTITVGPRLTTLTISRRLAFQGL